MNRVNKAYLKVQAHRRTCPKWAKEFCMDCFGGGLNRFTNYYNEEEWKENKDYEKEVSIEKLKKAMGHK